MPLSPIDRTALTSRTFDAVKFIAAIMVVCSHYIRQEIMPDFDPDAAPLTDFIGQFFFAFTAYAMVPMFFVISGYLLCRTETFDRIVYTRQMKSRLKRLGTVAVVFVYFPLLLEITGALFHGLSPQFTIASFTAPLLSYSELFPQNTPLWYIRDLLILCALSPLIHCLLRRIPRLWISVTGTMYILTFYGYGATHCLCGIFFFSVGYWLRLYSYDPVELSRKLLPFLFPLYILLGTYTVSRGYLYGFSRAMNLNTCLSVPVLFAVMSYAVERQYIRITATMLEASFFVYLLHHPFRPYLADFYAQHMPDIGDKPFALSLIAFTIILTAALICTYLLLKRFCPRIAAIITGRAPGARKKITELAS